MYRFHIDVPDDLWESFKSRAIQEHGSPRQAALFLFRQFATSQPDSQGGTPPDASAPTRQPK
jgi:hypothetical protein